MYPQHGFVDVVVPLQAITDGEPALLVVVAFLFALGLGAIYWGYSDYRTGRLVAATPTVGAGSASSGRTAVSGIARPAGETLEHPYTEEPCLYYKYKVREHLEKEGQRDRDRDEAGPRETEWRTAARGSDEVPFRVEDETGEVLIAADEGADFVLSGEHADSFTENEARKLGYDLGPVTIKAPRNARKHRVLGREISHNMLPPGEEVYVFGGAAERADTEGDGPTAVIGEDEETGKFLVSDRDRESIATSFTRNGPIGMALGVLVSLASLAVLVHDVLLV